MEIDKIYLGDCLEVMKDIADKSIDAIVTDLPFGVLQAKNPTAQWDKIIPFEPMWKQYERVIKDNGAIILFAQGMFTAQLMMSNPKLWKYNLIYDKVNRPTGFLNANRCPLRIHEDICVFYKQQPTYNPQFTKGNANHKRGGAGNGNNITKNGCYGDFKQTPTIITDQKYPTSIIQCEKEHSDFYHQTQKPVNLIRYLVRTYTNEEDLVLDSCAGSGTTAIACIKEKRHWICIEKDEQIYYTAKKRIETEQSQLSLF